MRSRKLALVASDDDDDEPPPKTSKRVEERSSQRKRKKMKLSDDYYDDDFDLEEDEQEIKRSKKKEQSEDDDDDKEDSVEEDAKPVGDIVRVSGKGRGKRKHYEAFDYDGNRYQLEDPVLLSPEEKAQKPYVAIIKDITQTTSGNMMVNGQWFYRPEEAEKKGGGNWQSRDTRELFYSFHRDEIPAESVMHKCVVHFIPLNKQIPKRKEHPGFIVQKVYDTDLRRLFKLTDKDYEDNKQHEIDLLVQKTFSRLGDVPDIETEDGEQEDLMRNKRLLRRKNMLPLDVSKEDESAQSQKAETPGSAASNSEYNKILAKFKAVTGETLRDRWLERVLQSIQFICTSPEDVKKDVSEENASKEGKESFIWPDDAVRAVAALEKASHESLSSDFQKYNQKMRQLQFNLKNGVLARRLLNGELEPSKILSMSPNELKEGLTAEEIASKQPEESAPMQMTDARCKRCNEKKVGLIDIIQAGHLDRYQLECIACGNTWYASRDEASTLTIDKPTSVKKSGGGGESEKVEPPPLAKKVDENVQPPPPPVSAAAE